MEKQSQTSESTRKPHCLAVPFPTQGHINPILEFSKRLIPKGIRITLLLTPFISKSISAADRARISSLQIGFETISDGHDEEGCPTGAGAQRFDAYVGTFREVGSKALARLVERMSDSGDPVHCIIYDSIIPWCLDVAKKFGILTAAFFTQSCAVDAIYYGVREGMVKPPPVGEETTDETFWAIPGLPSLERRDLPALLLDCGPNPDPFGLILGQLSNVEQADWLLCNSVQEVEAEELSWISNFLPFKTVGPTIPLTYLNTERDDTDLYGLSIFKHSNESTCANWLRTKPKHSVVYVSFGSIAGLDPAQMEELFWGLTNSNHYFLWVVRQSEESKLPNDSVLSAAAEKGLIVPWCSQLEVLASEAVGCFVTHCGWNSTLEGLSLGVPMVAVPQWSDQPTNGKYVKDVWRVGVRVEGRGGENGVVIGREEVERCLREVMEGERGEEIRRNSEKWKNVIREAAGEGGSSGSNIDNLVASLITKSRL